jgi:hypothetical protein
MENKYQSTAKFYGTLCVILSAACLALFLVGAFNSNKSSQIEKRWKNKYDSLLLAYKVNETNWNNFEKKSNGYFFVNPKEKKLIKKFKLAKFTEQ